MKRFFIMCMGLLLVCMLLETKAFAEPNCLMIEKVESSAKFSYMNHDLSLSKGGMYVISNRDKDSEVCDRIIVEAKEGKVYILLDGVNINTSGRSGVPAIDILGNCDTEIILKNYSRNKIRSGANVAGINKGNSDQCSLVIRCEQCGCNHDCQKRCGALEVSGGVNGAGIGSGNRQNVGNISINGGVITAYGGINGAGIGGGNLGDCKNLSVALGQIVACAGTNAAGIGGGSCGDAQNITINNGKVVSSGAVKIESDRSSLGYIPEILARKQLKSYGQYVVLCIGEGKIITVGGSEGCAGIGEGKGGKSFNIRIDGIMSRSFKTGSTITTCFVRQFGDMAGKDRVVAKKRTSDQSLEVLEKEAAETLSVPKQKTMGDAKMRCLAVIASEEKKELGLSRKTTLDEFRSQNMRIHKCASRPSHMLVSRKRKYLSLELAGAKNMVQLGAMPLTSTVVNSHPTANEAPVFLQKRLDLSFTYNAQFFRGNPMKIGGMPFLLDKLQRTLTGSIQNPLNGMMTVNGELVQKRLTFEQKQAVVNASLIMGKDESSESLIKQFASSCRVIVPPRSSSMAQISSQVYLLQKSAEK